KVVPSRTNQDLIQNLHDEKLFEFYATSQMVQNKQGIETPIGTPAIYNGVSLSPDKNFLLVRTIQKPFSYLIPAQGFPSTVKILDKTGKDIKVLAELPSS